MGLCPSPIHIPACFLHLPTRSQALLLLGATALACLALDLLFLLFYSFWLCCRRRKTDEHLDADCCCTAWCVIITTLVCSAGIAVGFYGNGETSDGIHRATYSLRHANRTVAGVQEPLRAVQRLQTLLGTLLGYTAAIPFWRNPGVSLEVLAEQVDLYDWYRWLGYLGLLLLDVIICLLEQPGSYGSQNPLGFSSPRGERLHVAFLPQNPFLCAGVWDQKEWAEDSEGLGVPVGASVAPKHDNISAGDPGLDSNWPGARNLQGQSSPAAASLPTMGMFLA